MSRERRVQETEEAYLGPVAVAQFVDCGWIRGWPLCWSRAGMRAFLNGFGSWSGTRQKLLYGNGITEIPGGAAHWPGRRTQLHLREEVSA